MQTLATSEKSKNISSVSLAKSKHQSFFAPVKVQPKLIVGAINDPYEHEADAVADHIMRMPVQQKTTSGLNENRTAFFSPRPIITSNVQRECTSCEKEKIERRTDRREEKIQKKSQENVNRETEAPSSVSDVLNSAGQPLDADTRHFFEPRFGHDFSNVKIHTGGKAAKSSDDINAHAYTLGNNIVFNSQKYSPGTEQGKRLLAHELTHVVQQSNTMPAIIQKEDGATGPRGGTSVHSPVVDELLTQVSDVHSIFAGRGLLPAERALANTIFRNSIDYSRVRLILGDLAAGTTAGNNIRLPRNFDIRNDEHRQLLIHEMTHVWQFQHNGAGYITTSLLQQAHASATRGNRNFAYDYTINTGESFFEFAPEQQAFIVENYFAMLRDQQTLGTPEGATAMYKSNHLNARGFNADLTAAQRRTEIAAELPLHEPLIRQMSSTPFLSPSSLLMVRQRDVLIMPPGGTALPPADRDQQFLPTPNLFEVRW